MGLRIISGNLRGKKLFSVRGIKTRPTADRLRESLFNILASQVRNKKILDLFAGTGALGIEALSRGAKSVVFVDNYINAISIIKKNVTSCNMNEKSKIKQWNILHNLNCIKSTEGIIDLVFMDPPYNKNMIQKTLHHLQSCTWLAKNASIIIEHSFLESIPEDLDCFTITDRRKYGKTIVSFLNYDIHNDDKNVVFQ